MILSTQNETPYESGYREGLAGKPGPAFPTPDSSWATRLHNRGWEAGADARATQVKSGQSNKPQGASLGM